jgi:RimJ/RimL family protein N-acetyltransferase
MKETSSTNQTIDGVLVKLLPHVNDTSLDGFGFQAELYSKKENMEFLLPIHGWTAEQLFQRKRHPAHRFWLFYDKQSGQRAGWTGFNKIENGVCNFGIVLDHSFWGKGLAFETMKLVFKVGFEEVKADMIELETSPENKGMRKLCDKFKMKLVHIIEKEWEGMKVTSCYYTLTKQEWAELGF